MSGYQPKIGHPVWWNGTNVNTFDLATGVGTRVTAISGWYGGGELRDVREARYGQDGEYVDNLYLGGKSRTIEGEIIASSWDAVQAAMIALEAVFVPQADEVLFKVPVPSASSPTTTYADTGMANYERVSARVVDPLIFGDQVGVSVQRWQVVVRSSDPRVYNDVATSTDSGTTGTATRTVAVDQAGSYPTPTTLAVTGPTASDWTISEPTSGLAVSVAALALGASEIVTIDTLNRTATLAASYRRSRTLQANVIGVWALDETSGTTADNAEGTAARDGTYTGGFTLNQSGHDTGIPSVLLNGSSGYVSIPYSAAINPTVFTIEGWFNQSSAAAKTLFDCDSGTGGWTVALSASGYVSVTVRYPAGPGGMGSVAKTPFATGAWTHVALVSDGTNVTLFVNGVRVDQLANPSQWGGGNPVVNSSAALTLGRKSTAASGYFNGSIDGVAMYGRAMNDAEVLALYTARANGAAMSAYRYLVASSSRWALLGKDATTVSLASGGLATGSKLNVTYRDARR